MVGAVALFAWWRKSQKKDANGEAGNSSAQSRQVNGQYISTINKIATSPPSSEKLVVDVSCASDKALSQSNPDLYACDVQAHITS